MIVCHCTGTTDRDIARLRQQGTDSVAAVASATGAGRNCAPCRREIALLLVTDDNELPSSGRRAA